MKNSADELIIILLFLMIPILFGTMLILLRNDFSLLLAEQAKIIYKYDYDDKTIKRGIIINTICGIIFILFGLLGLTLMILNLIRR